MLAGLLAKIPKKAKGKPSKEAAKILQLDRNEYFGSDSTSLDLKKVMETF